MKYIFFFALLFLFFSSVSAKNRIIYMEPCDSAKLINIEDNIIIGFENELTLKKQDIIDCIKVAGTYKVTFDASNFASGVYLYSLESGTYKETKKMLLVK